MESFRMYHYGSGQTEDIYKSTLFGAVNTKVSDISEDFSHLPLE